MSDIAAYASAAEYASLQAARPDYAAAVERTIDRAVGALAGIARPRIADFCCGAGNLSLAVSERVALARATLIDINPGFLSAASQLGIKACVRDIRLQDILDAELLPTSYDLVLSVFAYHHVRDADKQRYLSIAAEALRPGGTLVLTEIYLPTRADCVRYYDALLASVPAGSRPDGLARFLSETARSTEFEFKVPKGFADSQLAAAGFTLVGEERIWPVLDTDIPADQGTFVSLVKKIA